MKKSLIIVGMALTLLSLTACKPKAKQSAPATTEMKTSILKEDTQAPHHDVRMKFEQITLAKAANDFVGGTNLEALKGLFGEPTKHEEVPSGNVTLDLYTWQFDDVTVSVHLFQDSAIVKTISNFQFVRDAFVTKSDYDQLKVSDGTVTGDSFKSITDKFGLPDVMSQAVSSDKEEIQAIWSSGLKTSGNATMELNFDNDVLVKKTESGISEK